MTPSETRPPERRTWVTMVEVDGEPLRMGLERLAIDEARAASKVEAARLSALGVPVRRWGVWDAE